jgi:hypothetical protein
MAGSLGGRMLAGGVSGGASDAVTQFASTGKVDLRSVAMSSAIGAASAGRGKKSGCHSFAPETKVLMADGKTKAISDLRVGDRVVATDPTTGKTEARTVTRQHINRDRDLTNLAIRTVDGKTTTVRTTQNHPFWNDKAKQFVAAAALLGAVLFGAQATTAESATAATTSPVVESVQNYTGDRIMYDLTVDEIHTYYVIVGTTPVLVHNNNAEWCPLSGDGYHSTDPGDELGSRARSARDADGEAGGRRGAATYVAGYDPVTGRVATGRSGPHGCAEDDCAAKLGPNVVFTKAFGWRGGKWEEIEVCRRCQSKWGREHFPDDVTHQPGGSW